MSLFCPLYKILIYVLTQTLFTYWLRKLWFLHLKCLRVTKTTNVWVHLCIRWPLPLEPPNKFETSLRSSTQRQMFESSLLTAYTYTYTDGLEIKGISWTFDPYVEETVTVLCCRQHFAAVVWVHSPQKSVQGEHLNLLMKDFYGNGSGLYQDDATTINRAWVTMMIWITSRLGYFL